MIHDGGVSCSHRKVGGIMYRHRRAVDLVQDSNFLKIDKQQLSAAGNRRGLERRG